MNIIQTTFASALKRLGLSKKGSTWYLHGDETILVVELQKSNFGPKYFINVAVWLRSLGDSEFPKEQSCQIRTRLEELVDNPDGLSGLLDLERTIEDALRESELSDQLTKTLGWVSEATASIDALRSEQGDRLRNRSLITGPAQRLIAGGT